MINLYKGALLDIPLASLNQNPLLFVAAVSIGLLIMSATATGLLFWRIITRIEEKVDAIVARCPACVTKDELKDELGATNKELHSHRHNGDGSVIIRFPNG